MKAFKSVDLLAQIGITAFCGFEYFQEMPGDPNGGALNHNAFFLWLFVMGAWQVLSFLTHLVVRQRSNRRGARRFYGGMLLICLAAAFIPFYGWVTLLFFGPSMAIFYFIICLVETKGDLFQERAKEEKF